MIVGRLCPILRVLLVSLQCGNVALLILYRSMCVDALLLTKLYDV